MILSRIFNLEGLSYAWFGFALCLVGLTVFPPSATASAGSAYHQTQPINARDLLFFDDFPTTSLNPGKWTVLLGQPTIDGNGINEPSTPYSLRLNGYPAGAETAESRVIDLSGYHIAELTYWFQRMGLGDLPEVNEDLVIQFYNGTDWQEIQRHLGGNPGMSQYEKSVITLPPEARHANFRLRFHRTPGSTGVYDDWFVDDVTITGIIADDLSVIPQADFAPLGLVGGPFTPDYQTYRLTNNGATAITWNATTGDNWLAASPATGLLNPAEFIDVKVQISAQGERLDAGEYQTAFAFNNLTTGLSHQFYAHLVIKGPLIFAEDFPTTILDNSKWFSTIGNPTIDALGLNEPSPPFALRLNGEPSGSDAVTSHVFDLSLYNNARFTYWHQRTGGGESPEIFDDLIVQFWDGAYWLEIDRQPGDGPDMNLFEKVSIPLPVSAFHDQFKFRIQHFASLGLLDDWFVDDISITSFVLDRLQITPETDLLFSGPAAGPFVSGDNFYTLTNTGNSPIEFSASANQNWLAVSPDFGVLNPGVSLDVIIEMNALTEQLPPGEYSAIITLNNNSSGVQHFRQVRLSVGIKPILAYTEFTEIAPNSEYRNILAALNSINPDFTLTEFNDYTRLESVLPAHQVLLIPFQNYAARHQLETIGAAWAPALREFLDNAGVIIQCDSAERYGVLTGAGLMDITSNSSAAGEYVDVTATDDPLAQNLPAVYRALQNSSFYQTSEQTAVVEKPGYGAVVINKEISWGNVVLIGHSYQETNYSQNLLINNAVFNLPSSRDSLQITPRDACHSAGPRGGPFYPAQRPYTLTNIGFTPVSWQISSAPAWLDFDVIAGTLSPDSCTIITVSVNADANLLPTGIYSGAFNIQNLSTGASQVRSVELVVTDTYILTYTEFADNSYRGSYPNTLAAIRSNNPNFAVKELNDYTQLESDLSRYQALLIPQQKFADHAQLLTVGAAWKSTLIQYIEHGGILIQCDADQKYGILTGAGLMDISAGVNSTLSTLFVTDPEDPINSLVPDYYTAQPNSSYYLTSETNIMVENPAFGPVVINKDIRLGNAVLIGHDFFDTNPAQNQLITNALFNLPSVRDNLKVTPRNHAFAMGPIGGPFYPDHFTYTLKNVGFTAFDWTIDKSHNWFSLTPDSGILEPNQAIDVTVSFNAQADNLAKNAWHGTVNFINAATGYSFARNINLTVGYKHILTYTEFAVNPDYQNSLNAIQSTNPEFLITELNDYTQLDNVLLPIHDVILIPEQQRATPGQLEAIGVAWEPVLRDFVFNNGVVIQCDFNQKYGILTGANLMNIQTSTNLYPDPNGSDDDFFEVVAPDHPLAHNVAKYYYVLPHSCWYQTTENTSVIQYHSAGPVVIDKQFGAGDIVLIGHDYFTSYPPQDHVLGNAVFKLPAARDDLFVFPDETFSAAGPREGPFNPSSKTYTITNIGTSPLNWNVNFDSDWLEAIPASGALNPGQSLEVEILITSGANQLLTGIHYADIHFKNINSNATLTRHADLAVGHKKILAYTQYADTDPDGRYEHTLDAIASVAANFQITELLQYQNLDNLLPGHDILLIPHQISAAQAQMESIGALWSDTLQRFAHNGGVIIVCDGYSTFSVLTGAGFMDIDDRLGVTHKNVTIVAPDDPLGRGLPDYYTAMIDSLCYVTTEKNQVAISADSFYPAVLNKPLGLGHVVLIGHDYMESNPPQNLLVGNAVFNLPATSNDLNITPVTDFFASGTIGGPFTPAQTQYTLTNIGTSTLDWEITESIAWLDLDFTGGSLAPGQSTTITASLNDTTLALPAQIYSAPLHITNLTAGEIQSRQATLKIITPTLFFDDFATTIINLENWTNLSGAPTIDNVGINEPSPPYALRLNGDPFGFDSVTSKFIDLTLYDQIEISYWYQRTGGGNNPEYSDDLVLYYWNTVDWIVLEQWSGLGPDMTQFEKSIITLPPEAILPKFRLKFSARGTAGPYDDWFVDDVKIVGTLIDELVVLPKNNLVANGPIGGPFNPEQFEYTITNLGTYPIDFHIDESIIWLDLDRVSGSVSPGQSTTIFATVNATARILDPDFYHGTITFQNLTNQKIQHRTVTLEVMGPTIFFDDFPSQTFNPINWTGFSGVPTIDAAGFAEPSLPYSLRLNGNPDGAESVETRFIDLSIYGQAELSYWYQRTGGGEDPDLNEDLIVQFWDGSFWQELERWPGAGPDMINFANSTFSLPPNALQAKFRLRFYRNPGSRGNFDDWFVDDVKITGVYLDDLLVTPDDDFDTAGPKGGPFSPDRQTYNLNNLGDTPINWSLQVNQNWLYACPVSGTINPLETQTVTVYALWVNLMMNPGFYSDTITFTNLDTGISQNRDVNLTIRGIWSTPENFTVNVVEKNHLTETLTLGNRLPSELNFSINTRIISQPVTAAPASDNRPIPTPEPIHPTELNPTELLVRFDQTNTQRQSFAAKNELLSDLFNANIEQEYQFIPGLTRVQLPHDADLEQVLDTLNHTDDILYAQPNYQYHTTDNYPNDPRFSELWALHNTGQTGGKLDADIDAPQAWDIYTGSADIVVAVIDSGVDFNHPDLAANIWRNPAEISGNGIDDDHNGYIDDLFGYDFINQDNNPYDDNGHGTHVAGTIAAVGDNARGVTGVCWNAKIMALKFLNHSGSGSDSDAIDAIQYAIKMNAQIINASWGGANFSQALKDAIVAAQNAGVIFVAAAGNESRDNDIFPHYPSSFDPANIIAVLSSDHNDQMSSFSNFGFYSVDIAAPGTAILSCAPGGGYVLKNGTSMATPQVAGACALLLSINPTLTPAEIKDILIQTVDPTLPNKSVSGGRLNLFNAVQRAKAPWINFSLDHGVIPTNARLDTQITFDADDLPLGTYHAHISITSNDPYVPDYTVPVTMNVVPSSLLITPDADFNPRGAQSGSFAPDSVTYILQNTSASPLQWTAEPLPNWLQINPDGGLLDPCQIIDVTLRLTPDANNLPPAQYQQILKFNNLTENHSIARRINLNVTSPDTFTRQFLTNPDDIAFTTLTLTPDNSPAFYAPCLQTAAEFPTNPAGGATLPLNDDDFIELTLTDSARVSFYGLSCDRVFIAGNGFITFGSGDTQNIESLEHHFNLPRISALFTDLVPNHNVSVQQLPDRLVVTYQNIRYFTSAEKTSNFQIELFFNTGVIRLTWLDLDAEHALVGLSPGTGIPPNFAPADFSQYQLCPLPGDYNLDNTVNLLDLALLNAYWLQNCNPPDWCHGADLNQDHIVNQIEFAQLSKNWNKTQTKK